MRGRWLPWVVLAVVLVVALIIGSGARSGSETVSQRVDRIARDVRCPSCLGLSVAESDALSAAFFLSLSGAESGAAFFSAGAESCFVGCSPVLFQFSRCADDQVC